MNLLRQLEGFCGRLQEVRQALGKRWEALTFAIRTARAQLEENRLDEAIETLENMLQEVGRPEVLVARTRGAVRTRGGLMSAYQQTPGKMNESLMGSRFLPEAIDVEKLRDMLTRLSDEIEAVEMA